MRTLVQDLRFGLSTASLRRVRNEDDKKEAHDGAYWFNRGYALHQSDHFIEAIEAFTHSIGLGYRQETAMYNVACGYSLLNDNDNALFWLDRSLAVGFDRTDQLSLASNVSLTLQTIRSRAKTRAK